MKGIAGTSGTIDPTMPVRRMALCLLPLLGLVLLTFRDYGVTWDEPDHRDYGRIIVRYWASGFRELPDAPHLSIYGGAFDGPVMWIADRSPLGLWPTRHLLNALVGLAGIAGTIAAGAALAGPRAGFLAGALLALTPAWWGHMFNNPKDIPFAAAYIWAIAMLVRWLREWPELTMGLVIRTGLAIGLALGSRIGGVLLLAYLAAASVWPAKGPSDAGISRVLPLGLTAAGIAWAVMMVCWPAAQRHPVDWPYETLTKFVKYYPLPFAVMFKGQIYYANALPWDYLPWNLAIMLPELHLAGLGLAAWFGFASVLRRPTGGIDRHAAGRWGLVAGAAVVPILLIITMRSVVYNGIRHILFVVPPLCVIAGAGFERAVGRLAGRAAGWRIGAGAVAAAWLGWHAVSLVRIHPQEYTWYNSLVGGLKGAFLRYELDYWGNSYPEALAKLQAITGGRRAPSGRKYRIAACGAPEAVRAQLPDEYEFADDQADADFVVGIIGVGCGGMRPGPEVAFVTRDGIPLTYVRALRPGS